MLMKTMQLVRSQPQYQEAMLELHRREKNDLTTRLGLKVGISDDEEESDLRNIEQVYFNGGEFLIGLLDGEVMAMGGFQRLSENSAELRRMRIRKDLQDNGFGGQLLTELENRALQSGIHTLSFETAKARPLTLEFYHKHGYHEPGTGFYGNVETVHFSKILGKQVLVQTMNKKTVAQMISRDWAEWDLLTKILDAHPSEVLLPTPIIPLDKPRYLCSPCPVA